VVESGESSQREPRGVTLNARGGGGSPFSVPKTPTQPSATTSQATSPSDLSAGKADKQTLMKDCMTQLRAANPSVSVKDIQAYCDEQVKKYTSKPD
jgi:hypothetical protein